MISRFRLIEEYSGEPLCLFYTPQIEITDHNGRSLFVTIESLRFKFKTKDCAIQAAVKWAH